MAQWSWQSDLEAAQQQINNLRALTKQLALDVGNLEQMLDESEDRRIEAEERCMELTARLDEAMGEHAASMFLLNMLNKGTTRDDIES